MAPSSLQVYESYGLILLIMILAFDEVNDFVAASEHSNINGLNGILTGLLYGFQTLFSINFNQLIFKLSTSAASCYILTRENDVTYKYWLEQLFFIFQFI